MKDILIIIAFVTFCQLLTSALCKESHKCQPNANMKYELNHTHELKGYHSMCSEFAKRTCCSGKNFDALTKKYLFYNQRISSKLMTPSNQQHQLSLMCRRKLTTLLCSTCDGDIVIFFILFRVKKQLTECVLLFVLTCTNFVKKITSPLIHSIKLKFAGIKILFAPN